MKVQRCDLGIISSVYILFVFVFLFCFDSLCSLRLYY